MGEYVEDPEIINQLREEYDVEFDKVPISASNILKKNEPLISRKFNFRSTR